MWIDVTERLPNFGLAVPVHGEYTPNDFPKPEARLLSSTDSHRRFGSIWESREWRGTVGVTHWWEGK